MSTLIISGGVIEDKFLKLFIMKHKINNIIAVDRGLEILNKINTEPDYIIGDFDSVNHQILSLYSNAKIIKLNPEKDYTDTHMALKLAINLKESNIYLVGALGKRIDHTISNIHILKEALDNKVSCKLLDENNEIQLVGRGITKIKKSKYKYISLIPLTTKVTGVTLKGFKYPLINDTLEIGYSIGISNEIVSNTALIEVGYGLVMVIKSMD